MEDVAKTLYLEINSEQPREYLNELRLAIIYLLRLHFESQGKVMVEEEQFALYRLTDFLIHITKGDLIPIQFKSSI